MEPEAKSEEIPPTIHIPAENIEKAQHLAHEYRIAEEQKLEEYRDEADRTMKLTDQRVGFFERLIILNAGAFALSLSLLGALSTHIPRPAPTGIHLGLMYCGSILLLISILFSWLHNWACYAYSSKLLSTTIARVAAKRAEVDANFHSRLGGLVQGEMNVRDGVVEFSKMFQDFGSFYKNKSKARVLQIQQLEHSFTDSLKLMNFYSRLAILTTLLAFSSVLVFALLSSWILLLPSK